MRPERHSHAPGTYWYYNNWDFNALGTIFEQETGTKIFEEFDRRIAKSLQTQDFNIHECKYQTSKDYGQDLISKHRLYGFRMSTRDLARFGLLYLRNGKWQGQQIISEEWIKESTKGHSKIWPDGGYGYLWWTGTKGGFIANANVKEHCYIASGAGVNKVMVLPYRNLVVVHRVDTFQGLPTQLPSQVGRLLWLILDAAGEKDIGEDPSIKAAKGDLLTADQLRKILQNGTLWIGRNTGPIPGGDTIFISCLKNGKLFYSFGGKQKIQGKWSISNEILLLDLMAMKLPFSIVKQGDMYSFYDPSGTRFGKFRRY
jgi:CubicO group peptidase (beta-lactamase class C family)